MSKDLGNVTAQSQMVPSIFEIFSSEFRRMLFVVEHLEDDLYEWCILEYTHMMKYVGAENLVITNVSEELQQKVPESLKGVTFTSKKYTELGVALSKIALLDQCGQDILSPEDAPKLEMLVCGGILGCDEFDGPMVDRTSALRVEGVRCVNLGPAQMTADTAVIVSNLILNNQKRMDELKFSDRPSIKIGKKEYVDMPFRYLLQDDGSVLLPDGMLDYLRKSDFEP